MSQSSIHKMQRYIVSGVVLMSAIAISFPIAMSRVSATKKFPGQAVKSQDCASHALEESKVVTWAKDCAPLKVEPKKTDAKPPAVSIVAVAPAASPAQTVVTLPKTDESKLSTPKLSVSKLDQFNSLKPGMSGESVAVLQTKLQSKGVYSREIDGVFGEDTEAAVRQLQTEMQLESTGVADAVFQKAIEPQP